MVLKGIIDLAHKHLQKAIAQREKIYQGQREARALAAGKKGTSPLIEEQRWMASVECQATIADQNWQMRQADAHSGLATAMGVHDLLLQQKKTNELLEGLIRATDAIHDSLKEMKVY